MDNGSAFGEGSWIFGLIVLLGLFGGFGGGFGANNANVAAYATMADVNQAIANQSTSQALSAIQLSSANNNYETSQLISSQNMAMMQQSNSDLINAIQGFNSVTNSLNTGFASVNQNIANLGFKMEECCSSIKTLMLENRLQDAESALADARNRAVNAEQSQYLLSQMGRWQPYTGTTALAAL